MKQMFSRHRFLKMSLLAMGLLLGVGFYTLRPKRLRNYGKLLTFSDYEADVIQTFGLLVLPKVKDFPSIEEAKVLERLDEELFFVSGPIRTDFIAAIWYLEFLPMQYGFFSRFTRLSEQDRIDFIKQLIETNSDLDRVTYTNIRMLVFYMYYSHQTTWDAIGYDGPYGKFPEKLSAQRLYYRQETGGQKDV